MLTPVFRLIPFVFVIGILGLATQLLLFRRDSLKSDSIYQIYFLRIVSGLATTSLILILAAFTGLFVKSFLISMALTVLIAAAIHWRRNRASLHLLGYFLFCLGLGVSSVAAGVWTKPYEAIINSSDASLYVAFGFSIANSGGVEYKDPMISQMTSQEKELFYSKEENTYARFRGGVILRDKDDATIAFGFLPLFSAWLALGILFLGSSSFLYLLTFQIVVGSLALYWIGKKLAGPLLGIAAAMVPFFFLPQFYFLRLPFSEGFAQTLFLCGLFTFLTGASRENQFLTGILWGSIFLCRIEVMFTSIISIFLLFAISPEYKRKWKKYETFLLAIAFFLLLTFYWMLSKRVYLDVWGLREHYLIKNIWLPAVIFLSDALRPHPFFGAAVFACIAAILLLIMRLILDRTLNERYERSLSLVVVLFTFFIFIWLIVSSAEVEVITSHLSWTFVYFSPWVLALLLGGFATLFFTRRMGIHGRLWTIVLLLLPAAIFFIARPLILPQQPLYIRRCIPIVFPLFLLLGLYNWFVILQRVLKPSSRASAVFAVLALLLTGTFLIDTFQLIRTPLFAGVINQIQTMEDHLPQNALVIVPGNEAGVHLELPLQYSLNRDAITMPEQSFQPLLESFLKRQVDQKRPVFLLTTKRNLPVNPLPDFRLQREFKGQMTYLILNPSKPDVVPNRTRTEVLRYQGFRIILPEETASTASGSSL